MTEFDPEVVEQAARTVRDHSFAGCDITFNDAGGAIFCDGTSLANGDFASASEAREIHLALAVLTAVAPTLRAEGVQRCEHGEFVRVDTAEKQYQRGMVAGARQVAEAVEAGHPYSNAAAREAVARIEGGA